jgi:hypothetical protein
MMYVQSSRAAEIAGLTEHQLKEWCMRRGLILPDVLAQGRGHNALFGWHTLLALRLLASVHFKFGGSISHWGPIIEEWRKSLNGVSFPALYGQAAIYEGERMFSGSAPATNLWQAQLILPLDDHLDAIARALSPEQQEAQFSLLPLLLVKR